MIEGSDVKNLFRSWYLDYRSVRLFRILLAISAMDVCLMALVNYQILLSDDGILPAASVARNASFKWFELLDSGYPLIFTFGAGMICALLLIMNRAVEFSSLFLYFFSLFISHRLNIYVTSGWQLFSILLLISFILGPRGKTSHLTRTAEGQGDFFTFVAILQVPLLFIPSVLFKLQSPYWGGLSAVQLSLTLDNYTRAFVGNLSSLPPAILQGCALIVLFLEVIPPLLILLFPRRENLRLVSTLLIISLPLIFFTFFSIGIFPMVVLALCCLPLPARFWSNLAPLFRLPSWWICRERYASEDRLLFARRTVALLLFLTMVASTSAGLLYNRLGEVNYWLRVAVGRYNLFQFWAMFSQPSWPSVTLVVGAVDQEDIRGDLWKWYLERHSGKTLRDFPPDSSYYRMQFPAFLFRSIVFRGGSIRDPLHPANRLSQWLCREYNRAHTVDLNWVFPTVIMREFTQVRGVITHKDSVSRVGAISCTSGSVISDNPLEYGDHRKLQRISPPPEPNAQAGARKNDKMYQDGT